VLDLDLTATEKDDSRYAATDCKVAYLCRGKPTLEKERKSKRNPKDQAVCSSCEAGAKATHPPPMTTTVV
jgi:hypothetical protein